MQHTVYYLLVHILLFTLQTSSQASEGFSDEKENQASEKKGASKDQNNQFVWPLNQVDLLCLNNPRPTLPKEVSPSVFLAEQEQKTETMELDAWDWGTFEATMKKEETTEFQAEEPLSGSQKEDIAAEEITVEEPSPALLGLTNRGNTCYINAATILIALTKLNTLLNIDTVYFNQGEEQKDTCEKFAIRNNLYSLLLGMKKRFHNSHDDRLDLYLSSLRYSLAEKLGGDLHIQNDIAEFLELLLDKLESSEHGFDLMINEFTENSKDKDTSYYERPYKMLSLAISEKEDLNSALLDAFKEEKIVHKNGDSMIPTYFTKRSGLEELPKTVLIHLKRFEHTVLGSQKNQQTFKFPFRLTIPTYQIDKKNGLISKRVERKMYLKAIVVHTGSSINTGHYMTYECLRQNKRYKLRLYDDSRVSVVTKSVLKDIYQNAYILAYEEE